MFDIKKEDDSLHLTIDDVNKVMNEDVSWKTKIEYDDKGRIKNTQNNIVNILLYHPNYKGMFGYNEFNYKNEFNKKPIDDKFVAKLIIEIESIIGKAPAKAILKDNIICACQRNIYHPIKEWFETLKWDGTKRADKIFIDYLGIEDLPINRRMTHLWLLSVVKRVFQPGCPIEGSIILSGNQGIGKTTLIRRLCRYTNDDPSSDSGRIKLVLDETLNNIKEPSEYIYNIKNSIIINFDELIAILKADIPQLRSFLTKTEETVRMKYGSEDSKFLRHCVFIATTNASTFLRDYETDGERRFWVLECNKYTTENNMASEIMNIDIDYIDQLWAEIYEEYKSNPSCNLCLTTEEKTEMFKLQEKFKTSNDDDVNDILDEILEKKYSLNSKGCFNSRIDFEQQATDNSTKESNLDYINKIPGSWITTLLQNQFKMKRSVSYIKHILKNKWEYKKSRYKSGENELNTQCWCRIEEKHYEDNKKEIQNELPF